MNTQPKNKNSKKSSPKSKPSAPRAPRKKKALKPLQAGSEGNARLVRQPLIGMPDLIAHTVSWVAGSVYVGNGTLGATDSVYFLTAPGTQTVCGLVPIMGADTAVGASYVKAIEQLYRRKVYRRIRARFLAVQSSTTNNMTLTVAPVRGPPGAQETAGIGSTSTLAALTQTTVMSMSGAKTCDSFENLELDLTPYIAGGSGAKQNEFMIADIDAASGSFPDDGMDLLGVVPASFCVAGNSTVSALRATKTHLVVIETVCDYLDFQGAKTVVGPLAAEAKCASCAEKARMLKGVPHTLSGRATLQNF